MVPAAALERVALAAQAIPAANHGICFNMVRVSLKLTSDTALLDLIVARRHAGAESRSAALLALLGKSLLLLLLLTAPRILLALPAMALNAAKRSPGERANRGTLACIAGDRAARGAKPGTGHRVAQHAAALEHAA